MRLRVHHLLVAGSFGVIGLLIVLIVVFIGSGLREELNQLSRQEIERYLNLGSSLLESSTGVDADSLAAVITANVGLRATIIRLDGIVIGDSFVDDRRLPTLDNHRNRPEVQGVLAGGRVAFAERTSATVGTSLLYGARLSTLDGQPVVLRIAESREQIGAAVRRIQGIVALTGLVTMFLALAAVYALSKVFTRPLVALVDRAGRLSGGDFATRVPASRVAELQDLGLAFNRLTEELQTRLSELGRERDEMQTLIDCMAEGVVALTEDARLVRINRAARSLLGLDDVPAFAPVGSVIRDPELRSALERSVTEEIESKEVRLGERNVLVASRALDHGGAVSTLLDITELRRLEQVRRDFVANASHELKTPLTSIRGFAETLTDDDPPEALRKQFLESIRVNTLRLQRLVDDLLDLSRLESGGWSAASEEVRLGDVVSEAWHLASGDGVGNRQFTVQGDAIVRGDEQGLVQVFRNLFENAIRHTDEGGRVHVDVELLDVQADDEQLVRISVQDDGEGIPARSLPRIFERFYRADSSRARDFGGTGLGLAIVKHLVSAMGGDIEAHSELGRGTTITFTVPLA